MTENSILIRQMTLTEYTTRPNRVTTNRTIVLEKKDIERIVEIYCDREDFTLVKCEVLQTGDFPELEGDEPINLLEDNVQVMLSKNRNPKD